jgi:hypothetical protein
MFLSQHICNPSTQEAKAGIQGQPGVDSETFSQNKKNSLTKGSEETSVLITECLKFLFHSHFYFFSVLEFELRTHTC